MNNIEVTIDRIENDKAVIKFDSGETALWPVSKLPEDTKEGAVLYVSMKNIKEKEVDKKEIAKNILNEILNVDEKAL